MNGIQPFTSMDIEANAEAAAWSEEEDWSHVPEQYITINLTDAQRDLWARWAKYLRRTTRTQETGNLRKQIDDKKSGYCCLGIWVCMAHPEAWKFSIGGSTDYWEAVGEYSSGDEVLPEEFVEELGLAEPRGMQDAFVEMNDDMRLTFKEIAAEIEYILEHGQFTEKVWRQVYSNFN